MKYTTIILLFIILFISLFIYSQSVIPLEVYYPTYFDKGLAIEKYNNNFIISGNVFSENTPSILLAEIDSMGDTIWMKIINKNNIEKSADICISKNNKIFIAGYSSISDTNAYDVFLILADSLGDTIWTKQIGDNGDDYAKSVIETYDNSFIVAGYTNSYGAGGYDYYLLKIDSLGDTIWTKTYGTINNDYAYDIIETSDSCYLITGYTQSSDNNDIYLIKIDSSGDSLWSNLINLSDDISAYCSIEMPDKGFLISSYNNGLFLIKTDSIGDTIWTKSLNSLSYDNQIGYKIINTLDNNYAICGYINISDAVIHSDVLITKIDSLGNIIWVNSFGGSNWSFDYAYDVVQDNEGNYILIGEANNEMIVSKRDSIGNNIWLNFYDGCENYVGRNIIYDNINGNYVITGGDDKAILTKIDSLGGIIWFDTLSASQSSSALINTLDNSYIILGNKLSPYYNYDINMMKFDNNGNILWTKSIGGSEQEEAFDILSVDSNYIFVGHSDYDIYIVKTNFNGDTIWTKTYGTSGSEVAKSIKAINNNSFIIAGYTNSFGAGGYDYYLLKIDSLGDTIWTKTYGDINDDYAQDIELSDNGSFIITGYSQLSGTNNYDVYIVKVDSLGNELWTKNFNIPEEEASFSITRTFDGNYIIVGYYHIDDDFPSIDLDIIKMDSLGNIIWHCIWGTSRDERGYSLVETNNHDYLIVGKSDSGLLIVRLNDIGSIIEEKVYENNYNIIIIYEKKHSVKFNINNMNNRNISIRIFNSLGQLMDNFINNEKNIEYIYSNKISGTYFYEIKIGDSIRRGKFILF